MYCEDLPNGKVRFGMSYTDDKGKARKVSVTMPRNTATYRRDAERILNDKIRKATIDSCTDLKLGELAELYLAQNRAYIKEVTHIRNANSMKAICAMLGADTNVSKLGARSVSTAFYASGRNNSTLNEFLRRFKAFWRWAYDNDYVENVDWLKKLRPFPAQSTREKNAQKYLERDELQAVLSAMDEAVLRMAVTALALSGLRVGELLALERADVDIDARTIHVDKTYNEQLHIVSEGAKTYAGNRDVYIQDELLALCLEVRDYYERMGVDSELWLCDLDGKRLTYQKLNKYFAATCERVIHRHLSLHSLRHTHASLLFESGASLGAVSYRLGHQHSRVTEDIYIHLTQRKQEMYNAELKDVKLLKFSHNFPMNKGENAESVGI